MKKVEIGFKMVKDTDTIKLVDVKRINEEMEVIRPEMCFRGKKGAIDYIDSNRHYFGAMFPNGFTIDGTDIAYESKGGYATRKYEA